MGESREDQVVGEYYRAIDAGEYDALAAILAPEFVHRRPDRTIEGRETFVRFVREERPRTDTTHAIDARFVESDASDTDANDSDTSDADANDSDATHEVAVAGRLLDADDQVLFEFLDRHEVTAGHIQRLTTYTR